MSEVRLRLVEQEAERFLREIGWSTIPVDPRALAKRCDVEVHGSDKLGSAFSGCLIRHGTTFGILFSTAIPSDGFQRFTIAHELGHFRLKSHRSVLFADSEIHHSRSDFASNAWYEIEADHFAASLLMPSAAFIHELRPLSPGLSSIKTLADRFETSLTSTAIRYAKLTPDPAAIIVSHQGREVLYCFTSASLGEVRGLFLPKGTPVPAGTTTGHFNREATNIASCHEEEGLVYLSEWFDDPAKDFEVREEVLGLGAYGKTLTILHAPEIPGDDWRDYLL